MALEIQTFEQVNAIPPWRRLLPPRQAGPAYIGRLCLSLGEAGPSYGRGITIIPERGSLPYRQGMPLRYDGCAALAGGDPSPVWRLRLPY